MEMNKKNFDNFRRESEEALKEVAKKYGVEVKAGKISYSTFDFTLQLKATNVIEGVNVEQEKFNRECRIYGFEESDYKSIVILHDKEFELVGFNPRSPKNCCSIREVATGKTYKTSDTTVKRCITKVA